VGILPRGGKRKRKKKRDQSALCGILVPFLPFRRPAWALPKKKKGSRYRYKNPCRQHILPSKKREEKKKKSLRSPRALSAAGEKKKKNALLPSRRLPMRLPNSTADWQGSKGEGGEGKRKGRPRSQGPDLTVALYFLFPAATRRRKKKKELPSSLAGKEKKGITCPPPQPCLFPRSCTGSVPERKGKGKRGKKGKGEKVSASTALARGSLPQRPRSQRHPHHGAKEEKKKIKKKEKKKREPDHTNASGPVLPPLLFLRALRATREERKKKETAADFRCRPLY